jgi:hypothetical protein
MQTGPASSAVMKSAGADVSVGSQGELFIRVAYRTDRKSAAVLCWQMAGFKRPDPELLPIGRPRCPACSMRMLTADISPGPEGFEQRTFECLRCGHIEKKLFACDPLPSNLVGWPPDEVARPQGLD